jgi:type II restriction/modification system DNA methylase subunit YeeA
MKLNLYKCSAKDSEWYSLAKEICAGALPLHCNNDHWPFAVPPEKIEFFKEVEIDLSQFLEEEVKKIAEENKKLRENLDKATDELDEYGKLVWRLYFK